MEIRKQLAPRDLPIFRDIISQILFYIFNYRFLVIDLLLIPLENNIHHPYYCFEKAQNNHWMYNIIHIFYEKAILLLIIFARCKNPWSFLHFTSLFSYHLSS